MSILADKENMNHHMPTADKSQLRHTRTEYRNIHKILEERKTEILRPGDNILAQSLQKANNLYASVTRPQEATLDSRVLLSAAGLAQHKARNIKKGKEVFNTDEFISKLITFLGDDNRNLKKLGDLCTRRALRPPTLGFILGPLQLERKERALKAREARKRDKGAVVRPEALTDADARQNASNTTTKTTMLIAKILQQKAPIDLFSFIINPKSFSQSIENMFSLSFLIKEGRAGLYENDEGLQIIRHIDPNNPTQSIPTHLQTQSEDMDDGWELRQQGVMTLDEATWEEAIEILELPLNGSVIPHRVENIA